MYSEALDASDPALPAGAGKWQGAPCHKAVAGQHGAVSVLHWETRETHEA